MEIEISEEFANPRVMVMRLTLPLDEWKHATRDWGKDSTKGDVLRLLALSADKQDTAGRFPWA